MLARLKPKPGESKRNWLLFKERDQAADPALDILAARPESVKSGRRIEELVAPPPPPPPAPAAPRRAAGRGARRRRPPASRRSSPRPAAAPPAGDDWLHEIKFDGYRTLAHRRDGARAADHPRRPRLDPPLRRPAGRLPRRCPAATR